MYAYLCLFPSVGYAYLWPFPIVVYVLGNCGSFGRKWEDTSWKQSLTPSGVLFLMTSVTQVREVMAEVI